MQGQSEPCNCVLWTDGWEQFRDGLVECSCCSCLGGAELLFEFGPGFFDRIQIGGVGRQIEQRGSHAFDPLPDPSDFVRTEVVHDDDLACLKLRAEHMVEVGKEDLRVRCGLDGHGGDHAAHAHRTQDREDLPVAFRRGFGDPLAAPRPAIALGHLRRNTALIKEDEPFRGDRTQLFYEERAALPVRFGVALRGVERLFLNRKPSSPAILHRCGVLTCVPVEAFNSACNSRR